MKTGWAIARRFARLREIPDMVNVHVKAGFFPVADHVTKRTDERNKNVPNDWVGFAYQRASFVVSRYSTKLRIVMLGLFVDRFGRVLRKQSLIAIEHDDSESIQRSVPVGVLGVHVSRHD